MDRNLGDLNHVRRDIKGGGEVYVLDTGPLITSEGEAMLQALHSRSVGGIQHHLKILANTGPKKFMEQFYVGYEHKSIGDCGSTTLFIEGVSMLAAKAIQDNKLYSGQEASTRYIDFSKQRFVNPLGTQEGEEILESQRAFYLSALEPTIEFLKEQHLRKEGEDEKLYEKAIKARAFDITRGFLPAGASTNLAWHSNLRQIADKLLFLRHHPLEEIRNIAESIEDAVIEAHPSSFTKKRHSDTEDYQELIAKNYLYHNPEQPNYIIFNENLINEEFTDKALELINSRPPKTELPKYLSQLGTIGAEFPLDFGSFRDIQRHRAIDQRMPLVTTDLGFNEWYLDNLPLEVKNNAVDFLGKLEDQLDNLETTKETKQFYTPMGFNTSNKISGDLPSMLYMIELRSTRFVHPTLRKVAKEIGGYIQDEGVKVHLEKDSDRFDVKRGEHDITLKE